VVGSHLEVKVFLHQPITEAPRGLNWDQIKKLAQGR
jgi:hypothetical protein